MNSTIQKALDGLVVIFEKTEESLNEWKGAGNLQFPVLLTLLANKLSWDEDQVRKADPLVRYYVRVHPEWYVTRGAHGGIMKISDRQKKEAAKIAKSSAKDQIKAAIDAKLASTTSADTGTNTKEIVKDLDEVLDESDPDTDFPSI